MSQIRRPSINLPPAPAQYDQREQNEFRRIVMQALSESVEDLVRPSLVVSVAVASTTYTITVTWTGAMSYTIDGGSAVAGTTSPQAIVVTRNDYLGATKMYVFSVLKNGQTTSNTVAVPAVDTNAAATFNIVSPQTANAATNDYEYSWVATDMPVGTTFNVTYRYTNEAGTLTEEGVVNGATSGGIIESVGSIGVSPTYIITVNAVYGGVVIATAADAGTFST